MNERAIFSAACDITDPAEQAAFLDRACADDSALRSHIEELLREQNELGSFLASPAGVIAQTMPVDPMTEGPGSRIGPYKLLQKLGEGGMGVVYMAEQQEPVRRLVALKIIKPGMDSGQVIARFEAERQTLALMDHPNIAKIHDAGTTQSGRPYFVMELVKGIPITRFCDENQLTARERLELFVPVSQAVQHAHTKGIIHRDLKPSNVLVALYDDKPVPKVIDFGVAKATGEKLTDRTMFTGFGAFVGTLEYMSPEQAKLNALDIDARSDVYTLGVLLYELLTGSTPLEKERLKQSALDELLRVIREEEPAKPSTRLTTSSEAVALSAQRRTEPGKLGKVLRGDLDWIVMKALEKDRTRRYETASGLARDIERYLNDEPVEACPPSAWYRLSKMARRNKAAMVTAGVVAATLVLGIVGTTFGFVQAIQSAAEALAARDQEAQQRVAAEEQRKLALSAAAAAKKSELLAAANESKAAEQEQFARNQATVAEEERKKAQANETKAEWQLYSANIASAQREWQNRNFRRYEHFLHLTRPSFRGWEYDYLSAQFGMPTRTFRVNSGNLWGVAISPDGKWLATASDKSVKLFEIKSGKELLTLHGHTSIVWDVVFSPDGKRLATCSQDKTVKLWDLQKGEAVLSIDAHTADVRGVAFNPDGTRLASASFDKTVRVWDAASGGNLLTLHGPHPFKRVAYSADGKCLAGAGTTGPLKLKAAISAVMSWDANSGKELLALKCDVNMQTAAFSPDVRRVAVASGELITLYDAVGGLQLLQIKTHRVHKLAFSPDGKQLAATTWDGERIGTCLTRVWEAETGKDLMTFKEPTETWGIVFSPDGQLLVSGGADGTARVWDLAKASEKLKINAVSNNVTNLIFSPDGKQIACISGQTVQFWNPVTGKEIKRLVLQTKNALQLESVASIAFRPDSNQFATASHSSTVNRDTKLRTILSAVKLWNAQTFQPLSTLKEEVGIIRSLAFSPDGRLLAARTKSGVKLWNLESGSEMLSEMAAVEAFVLSPDGNRIARRSNDNTAGVWDLATGKPLLTLHGHTKKIRQVVFSPDGKYLATASSDMTVNLWDAASGKIFLTMQGHTDEVISVAFSPDGKRLASASTDRTLRLWDTGSGQELLTLAGSSMLSQVVAFSPDGKRLALGSDGVKTGTITVYDASNR